MYDMIELKHVNLLSGVSNKQRRIGKLWWRDTLTNLWNSHCKAEQEWLKHDNISVEKQLKSVLLHLGEKLIQKLKNVSGYIWHHIKESFLLSVKITSSNFGNL